MHLCTKAHRHFADVYGFVNAHTNRYSPSVVTVLFPVGGDGGARTDRSRRIKGVVMEVLDVGQIDVGTVGIAQNDL